LNHRSSLTAPTRQGNRRVMAAPAGVTDSFAFAGWVLANAAERTRTK
jgi:hypothetical protein